jgi:hypothetical protein
MIYYLVTQDHAYTINYYVTSWGKSILPRICPIFYENLTRMKRLLPGTYIFSDLERLTSEQAEIAAQVWEQLANSGQKVRLLNHPTRAMKRYELLRTLHNLGWNQFNVYRLIEGCQPQRFPVFLREEDDHGGSQTALLKNPEDLDQAKAELLEQGKSREKKIITEFCDTSDENNKFKKYSAFIIGDQIIPAHLLYSSDWVLKYKKQLDSQNEEIVIEEQEYIRTNPHESDLKKIAKIARIEYGRIDYSIFNKVPQVWEINTNPIILKKYYLAHIKFNHYLVDQTFFTRRPECWAKVRFASEDISEFQKIHDPLLVARINADELFSNQYNTALESLDTNQDVNIAIPMLIQSNVWKGTALQQILRFLLQLFPYPLQMTLLDQITLLFYKIVGI